MTKTKPLPGWEINPALQTDDHAITISDKQTGHRIALVCTEHPVEATAEEKHTAKLICALPELVAVAKSALAELRWMRPNTIYRQMQAALKKAGAL